MPSPPTRIAVFCGSSPGASLTHTLAARSLAQSFHAHSIHLVYGGGTTGLMGEVAGTLVKLSGKDAVTGVIPSSLLGVERPRDAEEVKGKSKGKEKGKKLPRNWARRMGLSGGEAAGGKGAKGPKAEAKVGGDEKARCMGFEGGDWSIVNLHQTSKYPLRSSQLWGLRFGMVLKVRID